ncbi:hypothetical protein J6590_016298 [Homalodisca vitripennis]|nr:hypothetical protein J6590_016298 [Homalodisca vitripennis]
MVLDYDREMPPLPMLKVEQGRSGVSVNVLTCMRRGDSICNVIEFDAIQAGNTIRRAVSDVISATDNVIISLHTTYIASKGWRHRTALSMSSLFNDLPDFYCPSCCLLPINRYSPLPHSPSVVTP